jgi:2-methylisocitrate lyase-like PEP mutase family enzyme
VNVLLLKPDMRVADLAALGVRRFSVGGFLARAAWAGFQEAAEQFLRAGTLSPRCFPKG